MLSIILGLFGVSNISSSLVGMLPWLAGITGTGGLASVVLGFFKNAKTILIFGAILVCVGLVAWHFYDVANLNKQLLAASKNNTTLLLNQQQLTTSNASLAASNQAYLAQARMLQQELTNLQLADNVAQAQLNALQTKLSSATDQAKEASIRNSANHVDNYLNVINNSAACMVQHFGNSAIACKRQQK